MLNSLEILEHLITYIIDQYEKINNQWSKNLFYEQIDLKDQTVRNIFNSETVYECILNYRAFINKETIPIILQIQNYNIKDYSSIETRVKTQNSIEFKLKNYLDNHENGNVPVIKCLNDILGIRIIFDDVIEYKDIEKMIKEKFPKLKCILAHRENYIATHIYIRDGKYKFPWELQIWNRNDEINNKKSHKKYKQAYTKWELENKGGEL